MTSSTLLQTKKDLHIARKIWHILGVSFILWLYLTVPYNKLIPMGLCLASFSWLMEIIRLQSPKVNSLVIKAFKPLLREGEKTSFSGMSYMITGALVLALLFPKDVVVLSLVFLGIGDPVASTFGVLYGKNKIGSKSLEGSLAAFIACSLASVVYYVSNDFFDHRIFLAVPLSGLWGAFAELIEIKYLDDNFTLPVLAGVGLWGLYYLLGA